MVNKICPVKTQNSPGIYSDRIALCSLRLCGNQKTYNMNKYETFVQLHRQDKPLILANSWNVYSARLAEMNGYKAVATSSLAIAVSLGYEDGENIPFS